jgi:hypothetical protein
VAYTLAYNCRELITTLKIFTVQTEVEEMTIINQIVKRQKRNNSTKFNSE